MRNFKPLSGPIISLVFTIFLGLTLSACGNAPPAQNNLLGSLRQKNHQLSGEAVSPQVALETQKDSSTKLQSKGHSQQQVQELEEIKIITPAMLEDDYPASRYLTGVGYSEEVNLNQAMLQAKEQVAASIQSEIESTTTVEITAGRQTEGNRYTVQSTSKQSMKSIQRVKFTNAELIKIDPKRTGCSEQRCVAVAYIARKTLAQEPLARFTPLAKRAKRIIKSCIRLSDAGDTLSFAERYAALELIMADAKPLGSGLEALLGSQHFGDWTELKSEYEDVNARRDELNALSPIIIDTQGIDDESFREVFSLAHQNALLDLGVKTRAIYGGAQACVSQPKGALHYVLIGKPSQSSLSGITIHHLNYTLIVKACATGQIIAKQRFAFKFSVPNNSTFTKSAEQRLKLKSKELKINLYKALHLTIPISRP